MAFWDNGHSGLDATMTSSLILSQRCVVVLVRDNAVVVGSPAHATGGFASLAILSSTRTETSSKPSTPFIEPRPCHCPWLISQEDAI